MEPTFRFILSFPLNPSDPQLIVNAVILVLVVMSDVRERGEEQQLGPVIPTRNLLSIVFHGNDGYIA